MENSEHADRQGQLIGRYQLEKLLGCGALSEVWLARDTQLRREVALKMLPAVLNDQAYLRNFMHEARAAAALDHPHILGIHDFGEYELSEGEVIPYLVMPYVAGGTLAERMRAADGPLPVLESLRYLHQAALAIDYAHSRRVLHRDIKPANMLLRDDWLLLSDFGLARVLGGTTMRGQTTAAAGTPEYMAPEQIMGHAQPASDRYSLAVIAYQLFTGRPPFQGATPVETVAQQLQAPLPPPHQLNAQIPTAVENLLVLALSRNPDLRPPSCVIFVDALQKAWLSGKQTGPSPDSTLIAPWNKRLQETNSAPSLPQPASTPVLPPITGERSARPGGPQVSAPSLPPVAGDASSPARAFSPVPPPGMTPPFPVSNAGLPPGAGTSGGHTLTDVNRTAGPPTSGDSFATQTDARAGIQGPQANLTYTQGMVPYTPGVLERKVGRRAILAGGAAAAVVVVGGGVTALAIVRSRGNSPQPRSGPATTPTPQPEPRKLIPGVPALRLTGHADAVWTATWHPSGRYLLTAGKDGYSMLWDIGTALQKNGPTSSTLSTPMRKWTVAGIKFEDLTDLVCWSRDGKKVIVSGNVSDKIYVLDAFASSGTPTIYRDIDLATLGDAPIYNSVTAGPSTNAFTIVNTAISGAQAQVWHLDQIEAPVANYDVSDDIGVLQWSIDGKMLAAMTGGLAKQNGFYLWQSTDRYHPRLFTRPQRNKRFSFFVLANTLAWSPVDPHLLLISDADEALIWDVRNNQPALVLSASAGTATPVISKLSWSPDGRYVAASYDPLGDNALILMKPQIFVWDVQTSLKSAPAGQVVPPTLTFSAPASGPAHTQAILDLRWSPDGRYLATSSFDKTVIIWKVNGG